MQNIAIIGGGAAGFFAAISAKTAQPNAAVTVFEKAGRVLAKVGVSGGGRCNLTNGEPNLREFVKNYPRGNRELLGAFSRFSNKDTMKWFETHQVALKEEGDGRVFPLSNSSQTIIDCFLSLAKKIFYRRITYRNREKTRFRSAILCRYDCSRLSFQV